MTHPTDFVPHPILESAPGPRRRMALGLTLLLCTGLGMMLSRFRWEPVLGSQAGPHPPYRAVEFKWTELMEFKPDLSELSPEPALPAGGGGLALGIPSLPALRASSREDVAMGDLDLVPETPLASAAPASPPVLPAPAAKALPGGAGGGAGRGVGGSNGSSLGPGSGPGFGPSGVAKRAVDPRLRLLRSETPHYFAPGQTVPTGVVWLRVTVDARGVPIKGEPISGDSILFGASLKAVLKWRWDSPLDHGHSAPFTFLVGVDFRRDR